MQYKVVKSKPFVKDLQATIDKWTKEGWELVMQAIPELLDTH